MGLIRAFTGAIGGTFADQWKDIFTAGHFNEHVMVSPGVQKHTDNRNRGSNLYGSDNVITNGSKIYVPENTAAFIFSDGGIETVITQPGGYVYQNGESSLLNNEGFKNVFKSAGRRFTYGGINPDDKRIAFINLREIRNIKFGTRGPQVYNDMYYGVDLEIYAYGSFTIQIINPVLFIQNFVPPNVSFYTMDDRNAREQLMSEFLQSFIAALNSLSDKFRISQLPSQSPSLAKEMLNDQLTTGSWIRRFGFRIIQVAVENIEFSDDSRALVREYSERKMNIKAYEDVSQRAANIAAQQNISEGIRENGLGNAGGMIYGMNMAQAMGQSPGLSPDNAVLNTGANQQKQAMSIDDQLDALQKLKALKDQGILTEEEFNTKKKEILGL